MRALNYKAKGSTMVEVMSAFIIVMLVFSMSVTLITQTYRDFPGINELKIMRLAQEIKEETQRDHTWYGQFYSVPGYKIEKKVRSFTLSKDLLVLEIIAQSDQKSGNTIRYNYLLPAR